MNKFQLIYADPPWNWKARSEKGEGRSAKNHYPTQDLKWIKDLPVSSLAEDRSVLCMWVIDTMLREAFEAFDAWGFTQKTTIFYWVKENKISPGFFMGNGYYTRANPEQCWIGTRTRNKEAGIRGGGISRVDKGVRRLIVSKIGDHSAKPEEARERLERLFGEVSRIELFARRPRAGWDTWGNEIPNTIELLEEEKR